MRTGNLRLTALTAAAVTVVAIGTAMATEGEPSENGLSVSGADAALVEALLVLEPAVPEPLPSAADLTSDQIDVILAGSFASARSALDAIEDDLRQLYIDADRAGSAVGDAVANVTRGLLIERQALLVLEATDDASNARPLDSSDARDADGVAIDQDGLLGTTLTGLDILLTAREAQRDGYRVLRDLPDGVDDGGVLADRYAQLIVYRDSAELTLQEAVAQPSEQLLAPVVRGEAPLGIAEAVAVTYVCVDRDAYFALADAPEVERIAGSVVAEPDEACLEAARRAGLDLSSQVATDEALRGVDTAVGTGGATSGS